MPNTGTLEISNPIKAIHSQFLVFMNFHPPDIILNEYWITTSLIIF